MLQWLLRRNQIPPLPPDDSLAARSIRYTLSVAPLVGLAWFLEAHIWFVYALVTATLAFAVDTGGRPLLRLAWMGAGGMIVSAGAALGTLVAASHPLLAAAFAASGIVYALTESTHAVALSLSRFLCFALAIGALYPSFGLLDLGAAVGAVLATWLISVAWDLAAGRWRRSTAPRWRDLVALLRARERERQIFAVTVALAIPLAYWSSLGLGIARPYWAVLALVLVLRMDFISSRRLMLDRFLGTVFGIAVAGAYAIVFPSHGALMLGIVLAALARWPAQQQHDALGVGVLTVFVMLMIELVSVASGSPGELLAARVLNTGLGCIIALLAMALDQGLQRLASRGA
ncbi:MAG: FUSC family protein [Stellaceae bacterium]